MIVEFLEGGSFTLGFVTNLQAPKGRMEVLLDGGRSLAINPARILVTSESVEPTDKPSRMALLSEMRERRETLAAEVDLETLWSVLEGEGPEFLYDDLAGLSFGRSPSPDDVSAVLRAVQDNGLFFEFTPDKARRRTHEEMERIKKARADEAAKRDFLTKGAEWLDGSVKNQVCPEPEGAETVCKWLMSYVLEGSSSMMASRSKELLSLASLPATPAGAFDALVGVGRLHRHENLAFLRLGLKDEFEKDILEEAQNLVRNFRLDDGGRIDLTSVPTATVDALGAKEFDDALSLEPLGGGKVRLGLHIADVASIVPPMSLIDRRAMVQPCSIYLPEARYPMLPEILTEEVASLKVGENRPALSLLATIDSDGQVLDWRFVPSVVYVDLQVSFIRATEMLETGNGAMLEPLEELAQTLLKRRLANDGQNLGLPHMNVNLDSGGQIEVHINDDGNRANQMVGELMILANHLAARTLMEANIPCPYRFQLPSRPLGWTPPVNPDADMRLAVGLASRRQTGRVGVTLEPAAHHGLGLTPYTSFTSPMRRYIDLLVARQMRAVSTGSAPSYSHQDMMNLAIPAEATHRAIRKMQNERQRYWLAQYLQSRVNEEFFGLVYDRRGPRLRICVTEFMLELELGSPHPPGLQPGARVPLRLTKVKPGADLPDEQEDFWRFEFSQRYRKPKAT